MQHIFAALEFWPIRCGGRGARVAPSFPTLASPRNNQYVHPMGAAAASFEVKGGSASTIAVAAARAAQSVSSPSSVWVFSSGKHARTLETTARALEAKLPGIPKLLLSGSGVLSEHGEVEGQDASTGIVWAGGKVHFRTATQSEFQETGVAGLSSPVAGFSPTCLFVRSEHFRPDWLTSSPSHREGVPPLFGAASHGAPGIVVCDAGGIRSPSAAVVYLRGLGEPKVQTTHSCRLLSPPMPITRCEGSMVFELGGEAALSVLERLGARLVGRPLLFTVLCDDRDDELVPASWLVRGIQGIDPARRALLVSHELRPGMRMTFAVKDSLAAREDLDRRCRTTLSELKGAAPRFGLYFNCAGRGRNLHASTGVDTRILRERFPGVPFAGLHSAFEIAPFCGAPAFQIYTGVLALFSSPS